MALTFDHHSLNTLDDYLKMRRGKSQLGQYLKAMGYTSPARTLYLWSSKMARRNRRYWTGEATQGPRTTLGGKFMAGIKVADKLSDRVVAATIPFEYTPAQVMPWLFEEEALKALTAAFPYSTSHYRSPSFSVGDKVALSIDFDRSPTPIAMLVPRSDLIHPDPTAGKPLFDMIHETQLVYEAFAVVKHVLGWLDGNATPGAIRYYWPTILSLIPDCEALNAEAPARFVEPKGISPLIPLIREAASTVASALLLPAGDERPARGMALSFAERGFIYKGVDIHAAAHTYAL